MDGGVMIVRKLHPIRVIIMTVKELRIALKQLPQDQEITVIDVPDSKMAYIPYAKNGSFSRVCRAFKRINYPDKEW